MTVILVLVTFAIFIALEYVLNRKKVPVPVLVEQIPEKAAAPVVEADWIEGFLTPAHVSYHPGHSWLARERRNLVRVGADEFATALMGNVDAVELPKPGQWIRQGQKAFAFLRDGKRTEIVSPTEGEVVEINPEVARNPTLLRKDPYGLGWLATIHVPDEESTTRNLVPEGLVKSWMREAVGRLYARQPQLAGAVAADGGRPAEDLLAAVPDANWEEVTREFFLTA